MLVKTKLIPVRPKKCATCPFRVGSEYANLADGLAESALKDGSRICHSTGANNAINHRTGKPPRPCRGARDIQLQVMAAMGVIAAPTDEAWAAKCKEMGLS